MRTLLAALLPLFVSLSAAAQSLPPGAQTWTLFPEDGAAQFVLEFGTARAPGDTIVVVHGGFGAEHSYLLDPLLPFADRYHFVFYDQRGSLRSQVAPGADSLLAFPAFVDDLELLRVQLSLDQLTLLAHSMGAIVSYGYLGRYPERVRGLALLAPAPPALTDSFDEPPADPRLVPPSDSSRVRALFRQHGVEAERRLAATLKREDIPDPSLLSLDQQRATAGAQKAAYTHYRIQTAAYNTCHPERWRELRGFGRAFYSQRVADAVFSDANKPALETAVLSMIDVLEAFDGPVAIVQGDCDYLDPGATIARRLAGRLSNAQVRVLSETGHILWIDTPVETEAALRWALSYVTDAP